MNPNRRNFLRHASALSANGLAYRLGGMAGLSALAGSAAAQSAPADYKALVCVFLFGGMDGNSVLIPYDSAGYAQYAAVRTSGSGIQLAQSALLPIQPTSTATPFGLHPNLGELQKLFNQKKLAFLANVGTLNAPTSKANYQADRPDSLYSHSDQQRQLRELDAGARGPHGGVLRVAGAVVGNQHAVAVHAAEEEDADQCLVVRRRRLRGGIAGKRGQPDHATQAGCEAACGKRGGVVKEVATVRVHISAPRNIARTTGRGRSPSVHGPARRLPVLRSRRR